MNNHILLDLLYTLNNINTNFKNNKFRIVSSNRVFNTNFNFFKIICNSEDLRKSPLRDIIINYFNSSEKKFPGISQQLSESIVKKMLYNKNVFLKKEFVAKDIDNLTNYLYQITKKEIADLFLDILKFSGPDVTINCEATKNSVLTVKKDKNSYFDINIHDNFKSLYFTKNKTQTKNYLVSIMDAYIERESELMPLFDYAKINNQPVVLICRGLSDYAVKNIKEIILKNKVYLYPYIAKFDNNDPFFLKDISSAIEAKILSAETGDNIYKDAIDKIVSIKLKLHENKIEIFHFNKSLHEEITNEITNCNINDLKKYLIKRKNRILPNKVNIQIPESQIEYLLEIKKLILHYNYIATYGLIKIEDKLYIKNFIDYIDLITDRMQKTLKSIDYVIKEK